MTSFKTLIVSSIALCLGRTDAQILMGSNGNKSNDFRAIAPPPGLTIECNSTFSKQLTCDTTLPSVAFHQYFPTDDDLTALCTTDCLQSLTDFRSSQQQSCSSDTMNLSGKTYPVTATIDVLLWAYNLTCYKDESGQFCAPLFDSWANGNSTESACSDCVLGSYQRSLNNALRYDAGAASRLESMVSSCSTTGYSVTAPPTLTISMPTPSTSISTLSAPTCQRSYTVTAGDTCHSISQAQNVSTANLLYMNSLQAGCANFPPAGTRLCLPHTCQIYTVKEGDDCWKITESLGNTFKKTQLVSWNIDVNAGCDNLEMLVGNQICISYPGDAYDIKLTDSEAATAIASVPANVAKGTNAKCSRYYTVQSGDTCALVSLAQKIPLNDFYFLNPSINSTTCDNLWLDMAYCVKAAGDISLLPGYGGRPTNPCVGGTAPAESSCYATSYITTDPWVFPGISTMYNRMTTTSAPTSSDASKVVMIALSSRMKIMNSYSTTNRTTMLSTLSSTGIVASASTQSGHFTGCNK